jgi:outer membrane protein TolC
LIPESKKVLELAEKSYAAGKTPLANVILAQQSLQQVIGDYTQAVIRYQTAWGDLESAVGAPMNAW